MFTLVTLFREIFEHIRHKMEQKKNRQRVVKVRDLRFRLCTSFEIALSKKKRNLRGN